MTSNSNSNPTERTARQIVQVDLGDLKAAVQAACDAEGLRLSDWVRRAIQKALVATETRRAPPLRVATDAARQSGGRVELDAALVQRLEAVVELGGFRTRPAALRALLDGVAVSAPAGGLREATWALGESNHQLVAIGRDFARSAQALRAEPNSLNVATRLATERAAEAVQAHLELAARVVARLRSQLRAEKGA